MLTGIAFDLNIDKEPFCLDTVLTDLIARLVGSNETIVLFCCGSIKFQRNFEDFEVHISSIIFHQNTLEVVLASCCSDYHYSTILFNKT